MKSQFTDTQLSHILDQSLIYQCACPAQVAKHIIGLRDLFAYQQGCLNQTDTDVAVHQRIATDAQRAHAALEECLHAVLVLEQWDMPTLRMPASLQKSPRII
ncbi:MAG: hypothetical protein HOO97_01780 [Sideroxydans sp.]|nr:hypothetical protein [Sideroxydans sp.]NOT97809.1 hypothetical protein [Sideroxydans sp.]